ETKSAAPFFETCSSVSSPKSRLRPRAALRAASDITFRRADWVDKAKRSVAARRAQSRTRWENWPRNLVAAVSQGKAGPVYRSATPAAISALKAATAAAGPSECAQT